MIKLFGVSVWIHSIFILILGVLLLLYTFQGDTKEPFQAAPISSTSGSGSGVILGPGASASGSAYDLTKCVPGYRNSLGSGILVGNYNTEAYTIDDCPIMKIQMDSLKNMAQRHLEAFESTSLISTQEQLCSLNISYMETGCNDTNSTMKSGSELIASAFGSFLGSSIPTSESPPPPLPTNIITGSMTLNTSEITLSSSATDVVKVGSVIYLGDFPTTYNGPYYITNISASGTVLTTSATNIVSTVNNVNVYWSPPLGRAPTPVRREGSNSIIRVNLYTGYRYIVMDDTDENFPENVDVGTPLYVSNCSVTAGPYLAASKPTSDRILFGHYIGSEGKRLAADGTFNEASILNGNMFFPLYTRPIPLSIKEVYLMSGAKATAASTCAKYGGTVATDAQITIARQNGADLSEEATSAVCWGNRPPHSSQLLIPFSSTAAADSVGVPYVASNRTPCTIGMFSRDGNCFPCPTGHYCPENATFPQPCPSGTYNPSIGQYTAAICETCPPGTICPTGTGTPFACPIGFICKGGANIEACPTGYYNPYFGAENTSKIISCPAGKYCPQNIPHPILCHINPSGAFDEVECPSGHYCPALSRNPVPCPAGTYSETVGNTNAESCLLSPGGFYIDQAGTNKPTKICPAGSYCPKGSTAPILCPVGTYCPHMKMESPISYCDGGYSRTQTTGNTAIPQIPYNYNNSISFDDCNPYCPAGYFNDINKNRLDYDYCKIPCPDGRYCPYGQIDPVVCPDGTQSSGVNSSISGCAPCHSGYFCSKGNKTMCPVGTYCTEGTSVPTPCVAGANCPAGTQVPNNDYTNSCQIKAFNLSDAYILQNFVNRRVTARVCKAPRSRPWEAYTKWSDYNSNTGQWTEHSGNLYDHFGASNVSPA